MKKILISLILVCTFLSVGAQDAAKPNTMYVGIGGGGFSYHTYLKNSLGAPSFGVEIGRWLMKPLAFQIAYNGAMAPGRRQGEGNGSAMFSFLSAEFKWDFNSTFFHVYNKTFQYPVPIYPMIGLGLVWQGAYSDGENDYAQDRDFQAMLGAQLPVRFNKSWSGKLEYKCFFLPQSFDGSRGDNYMHLFTAGLVWRAGDDPYHRRTAHESRGTSEDWFTGFGMGLLFNSFDFANVFTRRAKLWNVTGDFMVGRNYSNIWTIRFEMSGFFGRERYYEDGNKYTVGRWYTFNMLHTDFMINLTHLSYATEGWKWNVLPYLGAGPVWRYHNAAFNVGADAGVMLRRYVDNMGDVYFDAKYMMVPPRIAGSTGASGSIFGVGYLNFTVGYIYNFGHSTVRYRRPINSCAD